MTQTDSCPRCGSQLFSEAGAEYCPKCLGALGFAPAPPGEEADLLAAPQLPRLGDYALIKEIARGGMGVVYQARQLSLNRIVALKVVLHGPFSSPEFVTRFRTEATAIAGLQHPNIVAIYEVGQAGDDHFFSMEYIEGVNLAELTREQPLPARRAAAYLKTIAEAVHYAHQRGVLHRDLKPSNVLLDIFDQPRVTDFGLAKLLDSDAELTTTGQVLGSPSYIAPEQAAGKFTEAGASADVYSLGAILYHLLTGRPPFQGETIPEILLQVQNTEPVSPRRLNPSVPPDLQTICLKCLHKEPSRRYASAHEFAADLGRYLANEPIYARAVAPAEKIWMWCRRRPVLAALIVALHLAIGLGLSGIIWQWQRAEEHAAAEREQRLVAENYAARVRLNLYAGDVSFAAQALQRSDLGLARRTLAALKPQPGESDLRGFEWHYLWRQCQGDQLATLGEHERIVTCAAFSPDGRYLATGSQDQTVKIWDVAQRELVTTLAAATGAVWTVAFTPDARFLVTSGQGGTRLWSYGDWQFITHFPGQTATLSHTSPLLAVSEVSFFYWWQPPGAISVWNYLTGEKIRELPKPGRVIALAPDGGTLAVGDPLRGVDLWNVTSGELQLTLATSNSVRSLTFSPDGNHLLTVERGDNPTLHDLRSPGAPRKLAVHEMETWAAHFSPDGRTIATTSSDQTLRLSEAATGRITSTLRGHQHEVWCVAFSPDGTMLVTGGKDQKVMLWSRTSRPANVSVPNQSYVRPFFSPDGTRIVTTGTPVSRASSAVWKMGRDTPETAVPGRRTMGFSADGTKLVRWGRDVRSLEFVPLASTNLTQVALGGFDEKSKGLQYQGFTPDWNIFFAIDELGRVAIWEVATGKVLKGIQGPPPPISAGAISPGGRYLALGAQQESLVRFYDCETGRESQLAGHKDTVRGLAFSPDGTMLASGSLDGTIRLWDTANGESLATLPGHMEETSDVAFSPDGRTLASVNVQLSVKLWHVATRRELVSWDFPQVGDSVRFSPDGRFLAVTTRTNSIHLFEAPPLEALAPARR
ncbi:MAG: serine/threonine protein kinase [Verrucomicrobia bacterium]|nr:serine/threonine protein kinase [Verrucomicrobiota bacterium]